MDWWNVLKGRGKIRIPTKRKRRQPPKNQSKARYRFDAAKTRDAFLDKLRAGRQVVGEDGQLRQVTADEMRDIYSLKPDYRYDRATRNARPLRARNAPAAHMEELAQKLGEEYRHGGPKAVYSYPAGGNRRNAKERGRAEIRNIDAKNDDRRARRHAFGQLQVMDHVMQDSKARSTNTLPLDMGPPSKFRRRGNLKRESDRSEDPLRRKPVAHDRQGFRTGGGETLPLPDTQKERDRKTLQEVGEELNNLISSELSDRRKKVNVPRMKMPINAEMSREQEEERFRRIQQNADDRTKYEQRYLAGGAQQRLMDLSAEQGKLFSHQYDRAGNRIQGEQND